MPRSKPVPPSMVGWMRRGNTEFAPIIARVVWAFLVTVFIFHAGLYRVCVTHVKVGGSSRGIFILFPGFPRLGPWPRITTKSTEVYFRCIENRARYRWRLPENRTILLHTFVVPDEPLSCCANCRVTSSPSAKVRMYLGAVEHLKGLFHVAVPNRHHWHTYGGGHPQQHPSRRAQHPRTCDLAPVDLTISRILVIRFNLCAL